MQIPYPWEALCLLGVRGEGCREDAEDERENDPAPSQYRAVVHVMAPTLPASLDNPVGADEDRRWDRKTEALRRLHIDRQLEAGGLLTGRWTEKHDGPSGPVRTEGPSIAILPAEDGGKRKTEAPWAIMAAPTDAPNLGVPQTSRLRIRVVAVECVRD
jgi:hypothetical protein